MPDSPPKTKFEITVDLIKALLWPTITLFMMMIFWKPLRLVADQLPNIVSRSETITISGLSIKIRNNDLVQKPSDSVKIALAALSADGVKTMLNNSTGVYWDIGEEAYGIKQYEELIKLGLYRKLSGQDLEERNKQNKKYGFGAEVTPLGVEANKFLTQVVAGFVQELKDAKS